jgi:putative aminopeptidase
VRPAFSLILLLPLCGSGADSNTGLVQTLKDVEREAGIEPTGNFAKTDARVPAYYRCYYTGKLELPRSYDELKLRQGTKDGCPLDAKKYDIFFYPVEAVASGHAPITGSLAQAPAERVATVVPHEDFHQQIRDLPAPIAEAAATLVGFLTGAAAESSLSREAQLFLQKALLLNRYYDRLDAVYRAARDHQLSEGRALDEKQRLMSALLAECAAIQPAPRSFNRCVSASNNAGLAFDYTYTRYYPLLDRVWSACGQDLKCTIAVIARAPRKRPEREVVGYFQGFLAQ